MLNVTHRHVFVSQKVCRHTSLDLYDTNNFDPKLQQKHHRNISVAFLAQNLFPKNKFARTMSLNAHYMVLFKNPREVSQFANLARQMYPKTSQFAVEAYRDATREPYS